MTDLVLPCSGIFLVIAFAGLFIAAWNYHKTPRHSNRVAQQPPAYRGQPVEWFDAPEEPKVERVRVAEKVREVEITGPVNAWSDDCGLPAGFVAPRGVPVPPGMFGKDVMG